MADESWLSSVQPSLGIKRWCLGNIGLSSHQGGVGGGAVLLKSITQGEGGNLENLAGTSMLGIFQFSCTGLPGLLG